MFDNDLGTLFIDPVFSPSSSPYILNLTADNGVLPEATLPVSIYVASEPVYDGLFSFAFYQDLPINEELFPEPFYRALIVSHGFESGIKTFEVVSGTLPDGVKLSSSGEFSGTPTQLFASSSILDIRITETVNGIETFSTIITIDIEIAAKPF